MTRATLKAAGECLWGSQYRSEMARQLDVSVRTVFRWDNGATPVPSYAADRLAELLQERKKRIDQVLARVSDS